MSTSIAFPISNPLYAFPGSIEGPDGVFLASGIVERVTIQPDASQDMVVELFDAHDEHGVGIGSTNRARYEVDVTGLDGLLNTTPNRYECYGTGIVNFVVGAHNRKWAATLQSGSDSQTWEIGALCTHGMILRVTPAGAPAAGLHVSVQYCPRELGARRRKAKTQNWMPA